MMTLDMTALSALPNAYAAIRDEIYAVMFLLCLIGYYTQIWHKRRETTAHAQAITKIIFLILFAASIPMWRPWIETIFYAPVDKLNQTNQTFQYTAAVANFQAILNHDSAQTLWQRLGNLSWNFFRLTSDAIISLIFYVLFLALQVIASIIALPFYFLQRALTETGWTFAPIAFGALCVPGGLSSKASGYLSALASTLVWPLGFAIVAAMTNICFAAFRAADGIGPALGALTGACIFIIGTIMVPTTSLYIFLYGGASFNPLGAAASAIPVAGNIFRFRGR